MTIIELTSTIILSSAGILGGLKGIIETLNRKKEAKRHSIMMESYQNNALAYKKNIEIGQKYGANYSLIVKLHNSGGTMNELSINKISILQEYKREYHFRSKEELWQNRKIPSDMITYIAKLIQNESLHIPNICDGYRRDEGLRALFNAKRGSEVFMSVIENVGNSLIVLIMQMDFDYIEKGKLVWDNSLGYYRMKTTDQPAGELKVNDFHKLSITDQAHLKHIATSEISKLYSGAKWMIKNQQ